MHDEGDDSLTVMISEMNFSAEDLDEEDATAVTVWTMSWTLRVEGGMRRSLVKVRAMPPVAKKQLSQHTFGGPAPLRVASGSKVRPAARALV